MFRSTGKNSGNPFVMNSNTLNLCTECAPTQFKFHEVPPQNLHKVVDEKFNELTNLSEEQRRWLRNRVTDWNIAQMYGIGEALSDKRVFKDERTRNMAFNFITSGKGKTMELLHGQFSDVQQGPKFDSLTITDAVIKHLEENKSKWYRNPAPKPQLPRMNFAGQRQVVPQNVQNPVPIYLMELRNHSNNLKDTVITPIPNPCELFFFDFPWWAVGIFFKLHSPSAESRCS